MWLDQVNERGVFTNLSMYLNRQPTMCHDSNYTIVFAAFKIFFIVFIEQRKYYITNVVVFFLLCPSLLG